MEQSTASPNPVPAYYGQEYADGLVEQPKTLYERLRDYYNEGDFVTVMNIDTQPLKSQFATPVGYETYSDYPGHKNTVQANPPQVVILQPGQMKLCPAYEADLMIANLVKQMATRVTERGIRDGKYLSSQTTNWSDPTLHKELIPRIFKGKQDLVNEANMGIAEIQTDVVQPAQQPQARGESVATSDILEQLNLEDTSESKASKKVKA